MSVSDPVIICDGTGKQIGPDDEHIIVQIAAGRGQYKQGIDQRDYCSMDALQQDLPNVKKLVDDAISTIDENLAPAAIIENDVNIPVPVVQEDAGVDVEKDPDYEEKSTDPDYVQEHGDAAVSRPATADSDVPAEPAE